MHAYWLRRLLGMGPSPPEITYHPEYESSDLESSAWEEGVAYGAAEDAADRPGRPHPGYGTILRPLKADGTYEAFGTKGAYTPFPTDVARYYRDPAAYPAHLYHAHASVQTWYVDPAFWHLPTSHAGVSQGNVIEEAIWDLGCVCGLGVVLTPNFAAASVRWYFKSPQWIINQSRLWKSPFTDGNASAYLTIQPGYANVFLGDRTKQNLAVPLHPTARKRIWGKSLLMLLGVPYAGLSKSLSPFNYDEAWLWGYKEWSRYPCMRNPNMSAPVEHLEGARHWNHGYDSWEITRLRSVWGHQPPYYRWDRVVS
jgi:hypothetical protein